MIGFFALGNNWPELMQCWQIAESLLLLRDQREKKSFMHKIRVVASIVLIMALGFSLKRLPSNNIMNAEYVFLYNFS